MFFFVGEVLLMEELLHQLLYRVTPSENWLHSLYQLVLPDFFHQQYNSPTNSGVGSIKFDGIFNDIPAPV